MKPSSRRKFLGRLLASSTLAGLFPGRLPGQEPAKVAVGRPVRVGFLGLAHSHAAGKLKVVQENPSFELVGFHEPEDTVRSRLSDALTGVPRLELDDLLARVELVVVETAVKDLAANARRALAAGKHVHVEKPAATTLKDLRELVALAKTKQRLLQVGYMWRFNPGLQTLLDAAQQGWLGEVYLFRATMNTRIAPGQRSQWSPFPGGAMFEQGCHLIEAMVRLLGRPWHVTPILKTHGANDTLADNCVAVFEFSRALGIVTNATLDPNAGPHRFVEILGQRGTALLKPIEPPKLVLELTADAGPWKAGRHEIELPSYRRYAGDFAQLAEAIRQDKPLSVSLEQELVIHETVLRASNMVEE